MVCCQEQPVKVTLLEADPPGVGTTARRGWQGLWQTRLLSAGRHDQCRPGRNGARPECCQTSPGRGKGTVLTVP